jgi:hypothetical protein
MERAKMTEFCCKNSRVGILPTKQDKIRLWITIILATTFWLFFTPNVAQAKNNYYYIHVGSFRAKSNAVKVSGDLQKKGYWDTGIESTSALSPHIIRLK